ncbi:hypothetical protein MKEN_00026100 [Mycena kentingensis (nom. inval.)]|nr:hypothetical protein MKEN_00026100 [Mycena kentingensis (nom. inval.)]
MPDAQTSKSFMQLYESLPPEARRQLVEKKLAPLLDQVPKERGKKVLKTATLLRQKYSGAPDLDLRGKKQEISELVDELKRDAKRSIVRERSRREEIMEEIVESIVSWLKKIWTVVYEYNVHFEEAHQCLIVLAETLKTLSTVPLGGQCRCAINHLKISFSISKKGKTVKRFHLGGARHLERALLWIWRDLFCCMLAKDRGTENIPRMLSDIDTALSWSALERMLYGGSRIRHFAMDDDEEDSDEDESEESEDSDDDHEDNNPSCPCRLHGRHWSESINDQHTVLRDLVLAHLKAQFQLTPSHKLFATILSISTDYDKTESELLATARGIAGTSADALVAALDIHGAEGHAVTLAVLLEQHSYLLRPRDAPILQSAVAVLAELTTLHNQALKIAERELLDTVAAVRVAVRSAFCQIEDKASAATLGEIAKLRSDSVARQTRVDSWIDSVITPGTGTTHPMAFAAMMLGFPFAPGMEDGDEAGGDLLGFLDLDPNDEDLDDLRDEFRPKLRERWESWVSTTAQIKGGKTLLGRTYLKIVEEMPFFKMGDVVDEMVARIGDRPSKAHIADGMDAMLGFCKNQRKKLAAAAEKRRKKEPAKKAAAARPADGSDSDGPPPLIPIGGHPIAPTPASTAARLSALTLGGLNDVD